MQARHTNPAIVPDEQAFTTAHHVLPLIRTVMPITGDTTVIEIGCGEAGNLAPFLDLGCRCVGVDIDAAKLAIAASYFATHRHRDHLDLRQSDIHVFPTLDARFDLVLIRDAIEHIPDQTGFLGRVRDLLAPGGRIFVGFPPWQNPFGGHQHHLANPLLSYAPYWHLLPRAVCDGMMRAFGEAPEARAALLAIKDTGLSIEQFEAMVEAQGLQVETSLHYLINPNFEVKFGLTPRAQAPLVRRLPWVRNFLTTTVYYLLRAAPA